MSKRKIQLIPTLYTVGEKASPDRNGCFSENTFEAALGCFNHGADGLLLLDLSETDQDHDAAVACQKKICRKLDLPLYLGGHLKRLEDVKKYLYTGAAGVLGLPGDEQVCQEGAERFGKEKVRMLPELCCAANFDGVRLQAEDEPEFIFLSVSPETDLFGWKLQLKSEGVPVEFWEQKLSWSDLKKNSDGLVPAVVQDAATDEVLMLAYMNETSFQKTVESGRMTYFSRSRQSLWLKGETSGHFQYVKSLTADCDFDTLLSKVHQVGAACHTGARSCFFNEVVKKDDRNTNPNKVFEEVYQVILDRKLHPREGSYTNYLFDKGIDKILKKVGEEATEIVIAAKNPDPEEIIYEISDFLYHVMVLMAEKGVTWEEITRELANR